MRLQARTAIVTGAAQGIGCATAERFAAEGARLVLVDINADKLHAVSLRLRALGAAALECTGDVTSAGGVGEVVEAALRAYGTIDILVNNAGGSGSRNANDIEAVTDDIWDEVVALNLRSAFLCARAVVPHMKARRYGRIVNVSSGIARGTGRVTGTAGAVLPYAAAKAGLLGLTATLAKLLAPTGITVNAVVPGFVLTEPGARVRQWFDSLGAEAQQALVSRTSMGRAGAAPEVAAAILFLASEEAGFVSGAALDVTGAA
ncbi:MAG TPA: SDR family NAD(P)-dependent oxidoreductase [Burkholderiales bacterium]|nr:SDR family NAD(P)-dependent oxidoreductase [Burkholderiales bacterium]